MKLISKKSGLSYSIVIATYKEYPNLRTLLPRLCKIMQQRSSRYEIVIIDDNSQDKTEELVKKLKKTSKPIYLTIRKKERGLASALILGTKKAKKANIIRMDADWSHDPDDLEKMLDYYESKTEPNMVIGSRFIKGSKYIGKPFLNKLSSFLGRSLSSFLFNLPHRDLSNDFRIFPSKIWKQISKNLTIVGNTFLIQEIILLRQQGVKATEIPITFRERELGFSKLNIVEETKRFFIALPLLIQSAYLQQKSKLEILSSLGKFLLLLFLTVFNFFLFNTPKITTGNTASRVLLAVGPRLGIGIPYQDLFEYTPPGLLIALEAWTKVFGMSMYSFRFLHSLLIFTIGFSLLLILKKVFSSWIIRTAIYVPLVLIIFSSGIQTDMFSIESFATTFSLLGLLALLYIKKPASKLVVASALFLAASQIKETYLFSSLAFIYAYFYETRKKSFFEKIKLGIISLNGPLIVIAIILLYLYFHEAIIGYKYVLDVKFSLVRSYSLKLLMINLINMVTQYFKIYFQKTYVLNTLIVLNIISFIAMGKNNITIFNKFKSSFWKKSSALISALLFAVGIIGGFMIYGLVSFDMRMLSISISLFFIMGILLQYPLMVITYLLGNKKIGNFMQITILFSFLWLLLPNSSFLKVYRRVRLVSPPSYDYFIENKIKNRVPKEECILHIYGWEVAQTYIYTERRPCSKYFLANLVTRDFQIEDYRQEISTNPPAAIIYNIGGSDLNVPVYESKVLNFSKVIDECYTLDPEVNDYFGYFFAIIKLYWKNEDLSKTELQKCFTEYGWEKDILKY